MNAFLTRPLEGTWPYLWLDATYLKQREGGRIVTVAVIIAVAVTTDGRREIIGADTCSSIRRVPGPRSRDCGWTDSPVDCRSISGRLRSSPVEGQWTVG